MSSNSYWYLGTSLISLAVIIYVCKQRNTVRSLLILLVATQLAYLIETVIYIFLDSYRYIPKLLPHDAYYDSNMGALTSNLLVIPAAAMCIAVYRVRWRWIIATICLLAGIEWLYITLGIYVLYWWRIGYTSVGLIGFFWSIKHLYPRLHKPLHGWLHTFFLFLCTAPIMGTFHIIPIMLFMNRSYDPGWFANVAHDTTAFAALYYLVGTFVVVTVLKLRQHWLTKCMVIIGVYAAGTWILTMLRLLQIRAWWDPWYYILFPVIVLGISALVSKQLSEGPPLTGRNEGWKVSREKRALKMKRQPV